MTDFGRAAGDMLKSVYDADLSGVVDEVEALPDHAADHQDGGDDEISVAALSGELADNQPPKAHLLGSASHTADSLVNLNIKISDGDLDKTTDTRTPAAHKASHQDAGTDEIDATGLAGRVNYVHRGDPSDYDFTTGDFTADDTWRDLDLSSIVPAGATVAFFVVDLEDDVTESYFMLRKKGNNNNRNSFFMNTQANNVLLHADGHVALDANRVIQYLARNLTFTSIALTIRGWLI